MLEEPRLHRDHVPVLRSYGFKKPLILSATNHPDIKRTHVAISKRTGMTVRQVTDEVLYTNLIEMFKLDAPG